MPMWPGWPPPSCAASRRLASPGPTLPGCDLGRVPASQSFPFLVDRTGAAINHLRQNPCDREDVRPAPKGEGEGGGSSRTGLAQSPCWVCHKTSFGFSFLTCKTERHCPGGGAEDPSQHSLTGAPPGVGHSDSDQGMPGFFPLPPPPVPCVSVSSSRAGHREPGAASLPPAALPAGRLTAGCCAASTTDPGLSLSQGT